MAKRRQQLSQDDQPGLELLRRSDRAVLRHRKRFKRMWATTVAQMEAQGLILSQTIPAPRLGDLESAGGVMDTKSSPESRSTEGVKLSSDMLDEIATALWVHLSSTPAAQNLHARYAEVRTSQQSPEIPSQSPPGLLVPEASQDRSTHSQADQSSIEQDKTGGDPSHGATAHRQLTYSEGIAASSSEVGGRLEMHEQEPVFKSRFQLFTYCAERLAANYLSLDCLNNDQRRELTANVKLAWHTMSTQQIEQYERLRRAHLQGKLSALDPHFGHEPMSQISWSRENSNKLLGRALFDLQHRRSMDPVILTCQTAAEQEGTDQYNLHEAILVKFPRSSVDARQRLSFIVDVPDVKLAVPVTEDIIHAAWIRAFGDASSLEKIEKENKHTWEVHFTRKRNATWFRGRCIELNHIRVPAEVKPAEPSLLFTYHGDPGEESFEEMAMLKAVESVFKPKFKATLWNAPQSSKATAGSQSYTIHFAVCPRLFRFYLPVAAAGGRVVHARFNMVNTSKPCPMCTECHPGACSENLHQIL